MIDYILNNNLIQDFNNLVIVAPDANGVNRAKKFADTLMSKTSAEIGISLIVKQKLGDEELLKLDLVGDVQGAECIILDDIIDSAKTVIEASKELYRRGAKKVYVFVTHGVLSGNAIQSLNNSDIKKIIVTNTIPVKTEKLSDKFIVLSCASLLAETIRRIYHEESVSEIFLI
jgi:ribose-phosphate pyrophosphokinase